MTMSDEQNPAPEQSTDQSPAHPSARLATFGSPDALKQAAAQLGGNSVSVDPGGQTFPSIMAAINSITDNRLQKQYLVTAGPGTYDEQVVLKPYVYLQGAGQGQTIISYPPASSDKFWSRGAVVAAAHSNLSDLTVNCLGGSWGDWSTALRANSAAPFYADNVELVCDDQGNAGINMEAVAVDWNAEPGTPSQLYLSYSTVQARGEGGSTTVVGLMAGNNGSVECVESKIVAQSNQGQSFGVTTAIGGQVTLDNCYAQGATYSLYDSDGTGPITANNCQLVGPVSGGVVINNNNDE
jgi:hypothetical protein